MFAHALDTPIDYDAKIFNQNYRWSFDYVRWRSGISTPAVLSLQANQAPVVSAGSNIVLTWPTSSVQLAGSATDADGDVLTYAWSKQSGPGSVTFSSPQSLASLATFPNPGTGPAVYVLGLTASNAFVSSTSNITVTVNPPQSWLAPAWQYRKAITVSHVQVPANVYGFPVLVSITDSTLKSVERWGRRCQATVEFCNYGCRQCHPTAVRDPFL